MKWNDDGSAGVSPVFWSAAIPPRRDRFPFGRHVSQFQSADMSAHSKTLRHRFGGPL
jgi:hypothetical protein